MTVFWLCSPKIFPRAPGDTRRSRLLGEMAGVPGASRSQRGGPEPELADWPNAALLVGRLAEVGLGLNVNVPGPVVPNVLDVDLTGNRADVSAGSIAGGPGELYNLLRQVPEFQSRFADRLQEHFFHDGALTPANSIERYLDRADEIELALVAEAARWGDVRREPPDVPDGVWSSERDWIVGTFFPQRHGIVLDQFRARNLFTDTYAIAAHFDNVTISAEEGIMKPDRRIFQIALARSGIKPEEGLFVDDFIENVTGARQAGMAAIHFTDPDTARRMLIRETGVR